LLCLIRAHGKSGHRFSLVERVEILKAGLH
jgi:hypothetical protein